MKTLERLLRLKNSRDRLIALVVFAVAFGIYFATLCRGVYPGPSSTLLLSHTGLEPRLSPMHPLWGWLVRQIADLSPSGMVLRVHLFSAFCGALALAFLFLNMSWLVYRTIQVDKTTAARSRRVAVIAGLTATLALGFAVPYWIAATRCYYHLFDLLLLNIALRLLTRYDETDRTAPAVAFAFVYGIGLVEAPAFWGLAPVFLVFLILSMWSRHRLRVRDFLPMLAGGFVGACLFFAAAAGFYKTEGFYLAGYGGYLQIIRILLTNHFATIRGGLPRVGWMVVVFLIVVPWCTMLLVARRALNDERDWSYYALHVVMTVIALLILGNIRVAPWPLLGLHRLPVMPYLFTAMGIGYLVAYWNLALIDWWTTPQSGRFRHLLSRGFGPVVTVAILGFLLWVAIDNRRQASGAGAEFLSEYADEIIDSLEGKPWLVSNGALDAQILARAHERGIEVRLLNLAKLRDSIYIKRMKQWFDSPRLRNTAELGVLPLVQDWVGSDPLIDRKLAIQSAPDIWAGVENLTQVPNRTVYLAVRKPETLAIESKLNAHRAFWERVEALLATANSEAPYMNAYRNYLRRHTGFVANNFGVFLQDMGRHDEAFKVYNRVREIDPDNISAVLNLAIMVREGHHPESREEIEASVKEFIADLPQRRHIWALSRTYGYVRDPMAFAQLGWTWALSGQPGIAVSGLKRSMEMLPENERTRVKETLADIYLLRDEDEQSEALYWELLVENPENHRALLTLARIATRRGDFEQAEELLDRAEAAGVNPARLAMEWASVYLASGAGDKARLTLEELVDVEPNEIRAWAMLAAVLVQQRDLARLDEVIRRMETLVGPEDYLVLVTKAQKAFLDEEWQTARDLFQRAVAKKPNVPLVMEWVLRMDFLLNDKPSGEKHAKQLLTIDRENAFANYIMGSIMLERGDLEAAEDYLRTSVRSRQIPEALNDLADLLQQIGRYDEAEEYARSAYQLNDRMFIAWDTLGTIYLKQNRLDEAEEAFRTALGMYNDDLRIHLHMAQVQFQKGNLERAREIVRMLEENRSSLPPAEQRALRELSENIVARE